MALVWPPTAGDVRAELRIAGVQAPDDDAALQNALAAAIADVQDWRSDLWPPEQPDQPPPPASVTLGTVKYACALYINRSSITGADPVTGLGQAVDIAMSPTIARLLGIGRYAKPRVG